MCERWFCFDMSAQLQSKVSFCRLCPSPFYGGPQLSRQNKINSRQNKTNLRQNRINSRQNKLNSRQNEINLRQNQINSRQNQINSRKDPSHPLCFARLEDDMRHFRCHRNSSFLQCEFKSFYILPNIAHSGLNSPSTRSQTISGFI